MIQSLLSISYYGSCQHSFAMCAMSYATVESVELANWQRNRLESRITKPVGKGWRQRLTWMGEIRTELLIRESQKSQFSIVTTSQILIPTLLQQPCAWTRPRPKKTSLLRLPFKPCKLSQLNYWSRSTMKLPRFKRRFGVTKLEWMGKGVLHSLWNETTWSITDMIERDKGCKLEWAMVWC